MQNNIYFNQDVTPSLSRPSSLPKTESQTFFYSNHLTDTIKRLEVTQERTRNDVSELKRLTSQIMSQLKEFKNKTQNMLLSLGRGQKNDITHQKNIDNQLQEVRNELDWLKVFVQDFKKDQAKLMEAKVDSVITTVQKLKIEESDTMNKLFKSFDLRGLLLEDILKKQSVTDHTLQEELSHIKDLITTLTSQSIEQNDIQLEYQKLHEKLLYKIVEKQVDLEKAH